METQGSSSLAHLAADVENVRADDGVDFRRVRPKARLDGPEQGAKEFPRALLRHPRSRDCSPPATSRACSLYLPFDTDFYDHSIHEARVAYSTTGNLKEVVDDRRWVVGGRVPAAGARLLRAGLRCGHRCGFAYVSKLHSHTNSMCTLAVRPEVAPCTLLTSRTTPSTVCSTCAVAIMQPGYRIQRCCSRLEIRHSWHVFLSTGKGLFTLVGGVPRRTPSLWTPRVRSQTVWNCGHAPWGKTEWTLLGAQLSGRGVDRHEESLTTESPYQTL